MTSGQVLKVTATDPGSVCDMAAFAEQTGNTLLEQGSENSKFAFFLKQAQCKTAPNHTGDCYGHQKNGAEPPRARWTRRTRPLSWPLPQQPWVGMCRFFSPSTGCNCCAKTSVQANQSLRQDIRQAIEAGLPVYAECGGLMYLARSLRWKDRVADMVGALPVDVLMHERPVGRGYVRLQTTSDAPAWLKTGEASVQQLQGHEFHYSSLENVPADAKFAYQVLRGHGIDGQHDGLLHHNVLASYAHLRSGAGADWAQQFVNFVRQVKHEQAAHANAKSCTVTLPPQPISTTTKPVFSRAVQAGRRKIITTQESSHV